MFPQNIDISSASFTRPADITAYASGDQVANSTTAGSVVAMSFVHPPRNTQIRRLRLRKSTTGVTNASFRVHLFNVAPTVSAGDNAAMVIATGAAGYLGQVDIVMAQSFTDGGVGLATTEINTFGVTTIYALLEARAAYTPGSAEVFTLAIEAHV